MTSNTPDDSFVEKVKRFKQTQDEYIKYLLKIDAFETMAEMGRDLGISDSHIRYVKSTIKENET